MARRSKDGRILIRIGADSRKRLARNAALEKAARDRAIRKQAKKAATSLRGSHREIAKRAMQLARRLARERARDARKATKRAGNNKPTEDYNRQREENTREKREKRPFHPRGPYATEKYTSYARRLERSRKLRATRTSPTTFTCNGYTIKVTAGSDPKPLSCTCPDFTQIEGSRNWLGSKAGPFNPCKHMMAVRDLDKWECVGGVCIKAADGTYNSQAECEAALVPAKLTGGQCVTNYQIYVTGTYPFPNPANGIEQNAGRRLGPINVYEFNQGVASSSIKIEFNGGSFLVYETNVAGVILNSTRVVRIDGLPDNCGNPPPRCPT